MTPDQKESLIGKTIRIDYMDGEPQYSGRIGKITHVDDEDQIHGTWGGCAVCTKYGDIYTILG